jgi:hypothetical protein
MKCLKFRNCFVFGALLIVTFMPSLSHAASHWPQSRSFEFEVVDQVIHAGKNVAVKFRVISKSPHFFETIYQVVKTAIITQPVLEYRNSNDDWVSSLPAVITNENDGSYVLAADLSQSGDWTLNFLVQMPGGQAPFDGKIAFRVVP